MSENQERVSTPSSQWHAANEPDPHAGRYDCERANLAMGDLTDDELANGAFMCYDRVPPLADVIEGKAHMPIAWMTAVKDRIRWLSRALEKASAGAQAQQVDLSKDREHSSATSSAGQPSQEERLKADAHAALDAAERAWYAYAGACEVGPDRTYAFDVYERVRRARARFSCPT